MATKALTIQELLPLNSTMHAEALKVIGECDQDEPPAPTEFLVHVTGTKRKPVYNMVWEEYGPFNPRPEWTWDGEHWVSSEDDDEEGN